MATLTSTRPDTVDVAITRRTAMGTRLTIEVHGSDRLDAHAGVELADRTIRRLESKWSRFLPDSEISRCNATRGIPVFVSDETRTLVRHGIAAWERTARACDPTVLDALVASGYDRSFDQLTDGSGCDASPGPAPGCVGIVVDDELGAVTLPVGVGFDPGAIGKGLAADLTAAAVMDAGADGVFVSIGGDIRTAGRPVGGDGWAIDIIEPTATDVSLGHVLITDGAVATSTTAKRRWTTDAGTRHHLIDPATGTTAHDAARLATVVASTGWWAEALATQLLLTEPAMWDAIVGDDAALVVDVDGTVHHVGQTERFRR